MLAHSAQLQPHDLWTAWSFDPLLVVVLIGSAVMYLRGLEPGRDSPGRSKAFLAALAVIALALLSPVEAAAGTLMSGHMVQHVLLIAVAAPLLGYAAPGPALMAGAPQQLRTVFDGVRNRIGPADATARRLRHPVGRLGLFVASLWLWHASLFYQAALDAEWIHRVEHLVFLGAAVLLWSVIVGPPGVRADRGVGVMLVFLLVLQGVLLSALLTFSSSVWYDAYRNPAPGWNLEPLEDQHLAGLIMWFPVGLIYTAIGVGLVLAWINESSDDQPVPAPGDAVRPSTI